MVNKMNSFQAMVLDKLNNATKLEIKQLNIDDLPEGEGNYTSSIFQCEL